MTDVQADWIGVDWGTSNMRAWAMSASGTVLAETSSDQGMGKLSKDCFEPALLKVAGHWINGPTTIIACGMVGSRQGWVEAPYAAVPCPALSQGLVRAAANNPDLQVHVIPGIKQTDPADVMRGEETQVAGFLARNPDWDGVICLPGTHTKWVHVSADEVISFQTFMTGELFDTIAKKTILRHSITAGEWDDNAFLTGLGDAMARPEKLAARLFALRADDLLNDVSNGVTRARLSGLLIGAELAAAKPYWLGQQIAVIGEGGISKLYVEALGAQFASATQAQAAANTIAGLTAAYRRLKG